MTWIENLLIIAGISLDLFAAMECQGSLVRKVDKKQLSIVCVVVTLWQLIALFVGHFLSGLLYNQTDTSDEMLVGHVISIVIFFCLGIRLIVKAIRNEHVDEHLELNPGLKRFVKMVALTSIYTILAGIAFGFWGTNFVMLIALIIILSVVFVVAGMYTGYHFGFQLKTRFYIAGAALLWIAGIDIIIRVVLHII